MFVKGCVSPFVRQKMNVRAIRKRPIPSALRPGFARNGRFAKCRGRSHIHRRYGFCVAMYAEIFSISSSLSIITAGFIA